MTGGARRALAGAIVVLSVVAFVAAMNAAAVVANYAPALALPVVALGTIGAVYGAATAIARYAKEN